jgi:3-phenylpropionate/trans-cinnamate dioxygenase ferredoxin reductase subunit
MDQPGVIIVGSGQGGFQVAASLRSEKYGAPITLVGEEPGLPYQRPPLSKGFLTGEVPPQQIDLRPTAFYAEQNIALMAPERVARIDRAARRVELASGASLSYEHLVLATGARARIPAALASPLQGVLALRTRADAQALAARLPQARNVVIVGAGFIGMEVAAVARAMGLQVRVLECASGALQRVLSTPAAAFLTAALIGRGVQFSFSTEAASLAGRDGRVVGVVTHKGETFPADLVVVAVGVVPNVELAQDAGLRVDNGIVVDAQLLTDDPHICAIGDCARYPAAYSEAPVRLESVQNSVDQARCVAARIAGKPQPYAKVPWFWSDQGDHRLQIAGVAEPGDSCVLRGDAAAGKFSVLRFRGDRLSAVESVNEPADHMAARKLLASGAPVSPEKAADTGVKLASLTASP